MSELIRVVHIGCVPHAGVASVVFNYYRAIDRNKIQFDFIIDEDARHPIPNDILGLGCQVYKAHSYKHIIKYIRKLRQIFIKEKYQIVHAHLNTLSIFPLFAAWLAHVPVRIAHSHSTAAKGKGELKRNLMKYALRPFAKVFATHYFACSEYAGRWLFGNKIFEQGKVAVIRNAIDTSKFSFNLEVRKKLRHEFGVEDKFIVGNVGRFSAQKNHHYLLKIFAEVCKRDDNCVLLLLGQDVEENLRDAVMQMNLMEKVKFLGVRDDAYNLYSMFDVFVLPSLYEGLAVVRVEAVSAGCPSLVSTGCPCLVPAGNTHEPDLFDERFLPIGEDDIATWVNAILEKRIRLMGTHVKVKAAGLDIKEAVNVLEHFYKNVEIDKMKI